MKEIDGDEKNTILMPYTQIYYKLITNNSFDLTIGREVFMTIPTVIYTTRNYYLLCAINEKIESFNAAGLIDYWHSLAFDRKHRKGEVSRHPKILTFTQLSGGFELFAAGCLVSTVIFIYECFSSLWKTKRRRRT